MKYFKNKISRIGVFILAGGLLLTGCSDTNEDSEENTSSSVSENESELPSEEEEESEVTEESEEEVKTLKGTVKEGLMNTIIVLGEDDNEYEFEKNDEIIETGESGILIGNPITVEYKGDLDPDSSQQEVEVISMTVEDAE